MSANEYSERIDNIRERLKTYRPDSVVQRVCEHMHWAAAKDAQALGMPWIALFLLKLAMQESGGKTKEMTGKQFIAFANELFRLQHLAAPIGPGDPHLLLRPMILQQAWFQGELVTDVKAMTRQMTWYAQLDGPYDNKFVEAFGLTLEHFYYISFYLNILIADKAKGITEINLIDLIYRLTPSVPLIGVINYFLLVSIRSQDLPKFFLSHVVPGELNQQSEFFQTSPLRHKPILINGDDFIILNRKFFSRAICTLVPTLLKKINDWDFKSFFGPDMERYISNLMSHSKIVHLNEDELNAICRRCSVASGKMVDFMVPGAINVVIESKAIEPGDIVTAVFDSKILQAHLQQSFIKAIEQCQESIFRLNLTKDFNNCSFCCVIITHEDFWFASALDVAGCIDLQLPERIKSKYGATPIEMEKILFITIDMIESILASHADGDIDFGRFIEECSETLCTPEGRRFTMTHLIQDKLGNKLKGHKVLTDSADRWHAFFRDRLIENASFWKDNPTGLMTAAAAARRAIRGLPKE